MDLLFVVLVSNPVSLLVLLMAGYFLARLGPKFCSITYALLTLCFAGGWAFLLLVALPYALANPCAGESLCLGAAPAKHALDRVNFTGILGGALWLFKFRRIPIYRTYLLLGILCSIAILLLGNVVWNLNSAPA